ncbi:hypothetical protein V9K67_04905 [Paraflavisolibacter sp. H34]|uniref:hypothetical protein n=1 Tax=Huijunlia imazamoxiresistens TaxID=3127457 RepID=UPI003015CA9D
MPPIDATENDQAPTAGSGFRKLDVPIERPNERHQRFAGLGGWALLVLFLLFTLYAYLHFAQP